MAELKPKNLEDYCKKWKQDVLEAHYIKIGKQDVAIDCVCLDVAYQR